MLTVEWGFVGNFFYGFAFYAILKQLSLNGFPYHTNKLRVIILQQIYWATKELPWSNELLIYASPAKGWYYCPV
jgi:hypothetical protein